MKKKRENPRAEQPSSIAVVTLDAGWGWAGSWYYQVQNKHWQRSISYKSQKQAIEAALAAGFKVVKSGGKIVAKIKEEKPKEATDGQQEEVIEEGTQETDPGAPERSGV